MRIACVRSDGSPLVTPIWFIHHDNAICFTPRAVSEWFGCLRQDPRVALCIDEQNLPMGREFRLGGLVVPGSLTRADDGLAVAFRVTDGVDSVMVNFDGILPDLFKEGQGVIARGQLETEDLFVAHEVLAKHDENYMPPEVAAALEEKGMHYKKGDGGE